MSESLTIENIPKSEANIEVDSSASIEKPIPLVVENFVEKTKYQARIGINLNIQFVM